MLKNGSSQYAVRTEDLARLLQKWLGEYQAEFTLFEKVPLAHCGEKYFGRLGEGYGPKMGGVQYLSHWSGIAERRVRAILRRETQWTMIEVADQLLTAADLTHELDTPGGSIRSFKNPLRQRANVPRREFRPGVENSGQG